jgi:hypothetical protein
MLCLYSSKKAAEMGKKDDAHFQIPVGAPKKTSPSVPATSKKPTVQASSYSGVVSNDLQNRPRSSVASSNSKSHGQEENMALHKKSESSETQKEEKHVKKSPAAKSLSPKKPESVQTNLKFLVEGVVKNLSMTEHKPLLGLAEVRRKSDTSIQVINRATMNCTKISLLFLEVIGLILYGLDTWEAVWYPKFTQEY